MFRGTALTLAIHDGSDDPGQRQLSNLLKSASASRLGGAAAVFRWRQVAAEVGITAKRRELLHVAFDTERLAAAPKRLIDPFVLRGELNAHPLLSTSLFSPHEHAALFVENGENATL
jgi:hypothetical protein